jgi:ketosteroid isomerase-like protein
MTKASVEHQLLDLERQYWQAIADSDVETVMELTDDPCIVAGATGVAKLNPDSIGKMMDGASFKLNEFELKDPAVHLLSDDVAIVAYKVVEDLTVDGTHVKLHASDASTWMRRNGHWRCALHTESVAGDPYGRDRRA